ncbi:protein of unknown function [Latilactobacillus sakei]|nr:protein of unknown function [Latilactobacillus sakei]
MSSFGHQKRPGTKIDFVPGSSRLAIIPNTQLMLSVKSL